MRRILMAAVAAVASVATVGGAWAQSSCWNHNGSIMRFTERGSNFTISYERPRQVLRNAGVRRGTVLVNGYSGPGGMSGTARRFSKFCPGTPLEYDVSGYFEGDYTIYLSGSRQVFSRCRPTGKTAYDELYFEYVGRC